MNAPALAVSLEFDYEDVPEGARQDLMRHEALIRSYSRKVIDSVIEIGHELASAKQLIERGLWLRWLHSMSISPSTAENYMNVARSDMQGVQLKNIDLSALYVLATSKTPPEVLTDLKRLIGRAPDEQVNARVARALKSAPTPLRLRYVEGAITQDAFVSLHEAASTLEKGSLDYEIATRLISDPAIIPHLPQMPEEEKVILGASGYWQGGENPIAAQDLRLRDLQYEQAHYPDNFEDDALFIEVTARCLHATNETIAFSIQAPVQVVDGKRYRLRLVEL